MPTRDRSGRPHAREAIDTYFVPHDIPGLVQAIGGPEAFVKKVNRQFELSAPKWYVTPHGTHAQEWVDDENQPSEEGVHPVRDASRPSAEPVLDHAP